MNHHSQRALLWEGVGRWWVVGRWSLGHIDITQPRPPATAGIFIFLRSFSAMPVDAYMTPHTGHDAWPYVPSQMHSQTPIESDPWPWPLAPDPRTPPFFLLPMPLYLPPIVVYAGDVEVLRLEFAAPTIAKTAANTAPGNIVK